MAASLRRRAPQAWSFAPAILFLLLPASPLFAETSLVMRSDPGDYIGGGQSHYYDTSTGTFSANTDTAHDWIGVSYNSASHWWYLDFAAPSGQALQRGTYAGATRYPFQNPGVPGLSVYGDGRGCNQLTGDFRIREALFTGQTGVIAFWAEFEQHCEGGSAALRGEIRFNVHPAVVCDAPLRVTTPAGRAATFAVSARHPDTFTPAQLLAYGVPAGASFGPTAPDSAQFAWQPVAADLGMHIVSFVAVDSAGRRDSVTTIVEVVGEMSLQVDSESGDPVGAGMDALLAPPAYNALVRQSSGSLFATFAQNSSPWDTWWLYFVAPGDVLPTPGFYASAVAYQAPGNTAPEMRVSRNSAYCDNLTGEFQVKVAEYGAGDAVTRCWVRFAQRCTNGNGWLSGELRWNIAPSVAVTVPMRASARTGNTMRLGVAGHADGGGPVTFTAVGLPSGASLVPVGADSAVIEWIPSMTAIGVHRFTVVGHDTGAQTDSSIVTVEVVGESRFRAVSQPGDPVGNGQTYDVDASEGTFTGTLSGPNGVMVNLDLPNTFEDWSFSFAKPGAGPITPGTYLDANAFPGSGGAPGLSVYRNYVSCSNLKGDFRVRQVETIPGSSLVRFRADFEQRCSNGGGLLRGEILFNALVAIDLRAPIRHVGSRGYAMSFPVTATSATASPITLTATGLPAGATFDALSGIGTFEWTPTPAQAGLHAVTFVASASDGSADSVVTWVQVTGVNSLSIASDVGDPVGSGLSYHYGPDDATFSAQPSGTGPVMSVQPLAGETWYVGFAAPNGATLTPGFYFDAVSFAGNPSRPRLTIGRYSSGCYMANGRFEVKQVQFSAGGELLALWARFLQRCDNQTAALTGEIRFNADVRVSIAAPFELEVEQGQAVGFAIKGTDLLGRQVTLSATGLPPGASFVDRGNDTGELAWTPTVDQFGRYPVVFHAVNPDGDRDSVVTEILLTGRRLWTLDSDPGDPIGGGVDERFESGDGTFSLSSQSFDGTVNANFDPTPTGFGGEWTARFRMPFGVRLTPGVYRDAREPAQPGEPSLAVYGPASAFCYERRGQFRVRSALYDSAGNIQSLRIDFDHYCGDSAAGLHGSIIHRARAYVIVDAPISTEVRPSQNLTLDVRGEDAAGGPVTLTALDLPATASFSDHGDGTGTLTWAPLYADAGLHYPRLVARNGAGAADTVATEIRVVGVTLLTLQSDTGDPVGGGRSFGFTDSNAGFRLVRNDAGGVSAVVESGDSLDWQLHFAPPAAADFLPGDYPLAQRYPFQEPSRPGLWVTGGASCPVVLGEFTIRHLTWGPGNEVASFWATFEQHCNGVTPALYGQLLYNLDLAVPVQVSLVTAEARADRVELHWFAADHDGQAFTLERRDGDDGAWRPLAVLHPDGAGHIEYDDFDVVASHRYGYRLIARENGQDRAFGEAWVTMASPTAFALEGLRPNPAPGDLTVAFTLPRPGRARVQLLDVAGRAVVDRALDGLPGGRHTERIAARGDVPAGVYLVRLEFDGERRTRTAIVVR